MAVLLTEPYGLQKPDDDEFYDIRVHNHNMDTINTELGSLKENKANTKGYIFSGNIFDVANGMEDTTTFGISEGVTGLPVERTYWSANLWLSGSKSDGTLLIIDISHKLMYLSTKANGSWGAWVEMCVSQQGTWVPTLKGSTTEGTFVYTTRQGTYCRVGNLVSITGNIAISKVTVQPIGDALISGLPFAPAVDGDNGITTAYVRGGKDESLRKIYAGGIAISGQIQLRTHEIVNGSPLLYAATFQASETTGNKVVLPVGITDCVIQFSATYQI